MKGKDEVAYHFELALNVQTVIIVHKQSSKQNPREQQNNEGDSWCLCDLCGDVMVGIGYLAAFTHTEPTEHGWKWQLLESMLDPIGVDRGENGIGDVDLGGDVDHCDYVEVHSFGD